MPTYLLFESALGFALFLRNEMEEIALSKLQQTVLDYTKFSAMVKYVSFAPFESPEHGLENANNISEGELHEFLANFLDMNLAKVSKARLGLVESKLGGAIQEHLENVTCFTDDSVFEMLRGIRLHFHKFVKGVKKGDIEKAQLGLSHAYSRAKIKFNVNKADNMIIQSISMLDQLDKDINTYTMRTREWYAWHFPELNRLVKDNTTFSKLVLFIKDRTSLTDESVDGITEITKDEELAKEIVKAARSSIGFDTSEYDMINIELFANKIVSLVDYRNELYHYLQQKMHECAPNLTCLLGEQVGARLISHAGSLINLSKMPASTVQILGAEKALFRALKTRGPTPKYGLLFNSSFISKASKPNKGKVSRFLANKCSVAVRIDSFQDFPTSKYGEMLRDQVEERLAYYESGAKGVELKKNVDLMAEVHKEVEKEQKSEEKKADKKADKKETKKETKKEEKKEEKKSKKEAKKEAKKEKKESKKRKRSEDNEEEEKPKKKSKKSKEEKKSESEDVKMEEAKSSKKDKKDKKSKKDKKKSSKK